MAANHLIQQNHFFFPLFGTGAREIRGVVHASRTLVRRHLRIRTHRTGARHALPWVIVLELCGNEFRGGDALVHPAVESADDVAFGVVLLVSLLAEPPEGVRPGSSVAVI